MTRTSLMAVMTAAAALAAVAPGQARQDPSPLGAAEVRQMMTVAAESLADATLAVAVVDRQGRILGIYSRVPLPSPIPDTAVGSARTAAFFSHDQAPLSARTVRALGGVHFPANVPNSPSAALYGIENTNRGCQIDAADSQPIARPRAINASNLPGIATGAVCRPSDSSGCTRGGPVQVQSGGQTFENFRVGINTGKRDLFDDNHAAPLRAVLAPGGAPVYRNGRLIGGIGVAGVAEDRAEYAAFRGAFGAPGLLGIPVKPLPAPGAVFVDGIRLPFFASCTSVACVEQSLQQRPAGSAAGPAYSTQQELFAPRGGVVDPSGFLIQPRASTVAGGLTAADVQRLIDQAVAKASVTRAAIRLPLGSTTKMVISVSDSTGAILGAFRMPDATVFSFDVSFSKARNAYYFSSRAGYDVLKSVAEGAGYRWTPDPPGGQGWAITNRTLGFGGQPLFPPGLDLTITPERGPWFDIFVYDTLNPCTEGPGATRGGNRQFLNQSGIVWFAGSAPVYKGGQLVGGIGVSGDGVEQDDYVTAAAVVGFEAPADLRADQTTMTSAGGQVIRLPYWKFPRNPEIR
jgi:uncharacterized protein GlcG (DUF336 family)